MLWRARSNCLTILSQPGMDWMASAYLKCSLDVSHFERPTVKCLHFLSVILRRRLLCMRSASGPAAPAIGSPASWQGGLTKLLHRGSGDCFSWTNVKILKSRSSHYLTKSAQNTTNKTRIQHTVSTSKERGLTAPFAASSFEGPIGAERLPACHGPSVWKITNKLARAGSSLR